LPADVKEALSEYAQHLSTRFHRRLRFVRLFGSWARGEAREDSDIDVAVVIDGLTHGEWEEAVGDAVQQELAHGVTLSAYVISGEHFDLLLRRERRIVRDILEEGVPA
jgi:type I restriction enzyme S subunit